MKNYLRNILKTVYRYPEKHFNNKIINEIYKRQDGWAPQAEVLTWSVTYRCNLNCKNCYSREDKLNFKELSDEEIIRIFQFLNISKFKLTGGEIFVRSDIYRILNLLCAKGFIQDITTNGTMFTIESLIKIANFIKKGQIKNITFSIDGKEEFHEKIRGKGSFKKTIQNILLLTKELKKLNVNPQKHLILRSTIKEENISNLTDILCIAKDLDIDRIGINHLLFATDEELQQTQVYWEDLTPEILNTCILANHKLDGKIIANVIQDVKEKGAKMKIYITTRPNINFQQTIEYYNAVNLSPKTKCLYPFFNPRISPDGKVEFCFLIKKEMGDLKEQSFKEIWNGEMYRKYRKLLLKYDTFPICKRCCVVKYV